MGGAVAWITETSGCMFGGLDWDGDGVSEIGCREVLECGDDGAWNGV
jgi:hypothetical protein